MRKEEYRSLVFIVGIVVLTIFLAAFVYLFMWTDGQWIPTPTIYFSDPTKTTTDSTYYYNMTVLNITVYNTSTSVNTNTSIKPEDIKIIVSHYGNVSLSAICGEYKQINSNIYLQWIDSNLNNMFDANDDLSIKTINLTNLAGEKVRLIYVPVNSIMAEVCMP